ncbi:acyl-CoA thioesterase [Rubritalea marina]|uniref:acyl-CoA thioesterase n=1 Tax=Rubritalea marina TaxID=361055 RepID=UPI000372DE38|nr:hotdog domain-containing protein [Rubritalea marina]
MVKDPEESSVTLTELMLPSHSNFSGKIHGGYILNLMDQIAFAAASKFSGKYCVTASINKVDFKNPVSVGELLTLKARVNYVGRTSMTVGIRVTSENIQTGEIKHCNSSYFVMVAKDEDGNNAMVPELKLSSNEDVRRFVRAKSKLENTRARVREFDAATFDPEQHLDSLKEHRVLLRLEDSE